MFASTTANQAMLVKRLHYSCPASRIGLHNPGHFVARIPRRKMATNVLFQNPLARSRDHGWKQRPNPKLYFFKDRGFVKRKTPPVSFITFCRPLQISKIGKQHVAPHFKHHPQHSSSQEELLQMNRKKISALVFNWTECCNIAPLKVLNTLPGWRNW